MSYQVLARTWRPQTFDDLLGQEPVVRTLSNALTSNTLGHAYLFSGLRGVGKTTAARLLAKAVNCVNGPTATPCGECPSCLEIAAGSSLDMVEIDGASNRKIDDVRGLKEMLRFRPTRDRYRVVVIDEVHMLTTEAFNALLKTLEEPPSWVVFVLATTERHKVPPTILSRCQQLEFRPIATDRIADHLRTIAEREGFDLEPAAAAMIARAARGSVRDGLSLLDQLRAFSAGDVDEEAVATVLGVPPLEAMERLVRCLAAGDAGQALGLLRVELGAGRDPSVLYQETGRLLRNLIQLALTPDSDSEYTADQQASLAAFAADLGAGPLVRMLGLWVDHELLLKGSGNRELALEVACLRLARWPAVQRVEALLDGRVELPAATGGGGSEGSGSPSTGGGDSSSHPAGSPGDRLVKGLWDDSPRVAGAVDVAAVRVAEDELVLSFAADHRSLARFLDRGEGRTALETAAARLLPAIARIRLEVAGLEVDRQDDRSPLEREAAADPGVALALSVIGGQIVDVRPDREPS
jgi:DNA polymerase-3 subunit gamma/tau